MALMTPNFFEILWIEEIFNPVYYFSLFTYSGLLPLKLSVYTKSLKNIVKKDWIVIDK